MVIPNKPIQKGFTLVELLLAMSLLLLVMFSGYYAYSLFSSSWEKRSNIFWQSTKNALAFDSLNRAFASAVPYIVTSDNEKPAIYFHGDDNRVIFVTSSPIYAESDAIVELEFYNKGAAGSVLVYKETMLANMLLLNQSDEVFWQHQVILMDGLSNTSFQYFGWASYEQVLSNIQKEQEADGDESVEYTPPSWYTNHDLHKQRVSPIKSRLSFTDSEGRKTSLDLVLPENAHLNLIHYLREDG